MRGITIVCLLILSLAQTSRPQRIVCRPQGKQLSEAGCSSLMGSDDDFPDPVNDTHNNTEQRNETTAISEANATVVTQNTSLHKPEKFETEQTTQQSNSRVKRETADSDSGWHPFSSGGAGFAPQGASEKNTTTEETRLNETAKVLKVNETATEEKTLNETAEILEVSKTVTKKPLTKIKIRVKQAPAPPLILDWHPFRSNGSGFAPQSENKEKATV